MTAGAEVSPTGKHLSDWEACPRPGEGMSPAREARDRSGPSFQGLSAVSGVIAPETADKSG